MYNISLPKTNTELRDNNTKLVFYAMQSHSPVLRRELQACTGLSWGNISVTVAALKEAGVVRETNYLNTVSGRKPKCLDINSDKHCILGIDLHRTMIYGVLADLKGKVQKEYTHTLIYNDRKSILADLLAFIKKIIDSTEVNHIVSVGLAVQGIVNKSNTTSKYFPGFSDWENVQLREFLLDNLEMSAYVFHDPDAIMRAELQIGDIKNKPLKNIALIRIFEGIGMSIMINRDIFTSFTGKSGELGHINIVPLGIPCSCGDRGCLEPYVTIKGIINRFLNESLHENTSVKTESQHNVTIHTLATAAKNGDPLCSRLFREMGEYLGIAISTYINIINPQMIIIEGEITNFRALFEDDLRISIEKHVWNHNETKVVFLEHNPFYAAIGAALMGLDKHIDATPNIMDLFKDAP